MSLNRRKNIYTLGDFHQQQPLKALSRRQNSDPFERDPFKIQSYKFHYADRPLFPLHDLGNRSHPQNSPAAPKRFETFYYNHDFAPTRNDKENNSTNKFHEFRRRKFLYDHQQAAPAQHPAHNQQHRQMYPTTQQLVPQHSRQNLGRPTTTSSCELPSTSNAYGASTSGQNMSRLCTVHASNATATNSDSVKPNVGVSVYQQPKQQQQQQQQQQQRNSLDVACSKISVASCGSSGGLRRQSKANSNTNKLTKCNSFSEKVSSSCTRLSTSQYNRRLQTLHAPSKNEITTSVGAEVERKASSCSGCQININIKGLDEKQLGENVTINIETEPCKKHLNLMRPQQQRSQQEQRAQQPQQQEQWDQQLKDQELKNNLAKLNNKPFKEIQKPLNLSRSGSSNSLIVDKRLSKTSEISNTFRPIKRPESCTANDFKPISPFVVPRRPNLERMPSIVPFNGDRSRRESYTKENNSAQVVLNEVRLAAERPLQQMRSARNSFNTAFNDLKALNNYEKLLKARAGGASSSAVASTSFPMPSRSKPMKPDHKLLNIPTLANRKYEVIMAQSYEPTRRCKRLDSLSRLSLRGPTEKCSCSRNSVTNCRSSETQFSNGRSSSQHYNSRRSLSPVSVNINVYADKLKLLRV